MDDQGLTWILSPPKIKLQPNHNGRQPYPLSWDEQERLFRELPAHLWEMSLFAVNTGCRDAEVCGLRWDWEVDVPIFGTSVFIVPGMRVKNGTDRLVVSTLWLQRSSSACVVGIPRTCLPIATHQSNTS